MKWWVRITNRQTGIVHSERYCAGFIKEDTTREQAEAHIQRVNDFGAYHCELIDNEDRIQGMLEITE